MRGFDLLLDEAENHINNSPENNMTTAYHASVWRKAMHEAEYDVMRATAPPVGGRKNGEELIAYVERAKQIQAAAVARWLTARSEFEAAGGYWTGLTRSEP